MELVGYKEHIEYNNFVAADERCRAGARGSKGGYKLRIMNGRNAGGTPAVPGDYRLRITDYGLRITDYRLRITDYGLRITDYGLQITDYGLRITDYELRKCRSGDQRSRGKKCGRDACGPGVKSACGSGWQYLSQVIK
jgi:hypothetical protein